MALYQLVVYSGSSRNPHLDQELVVEVEAILLRKLLIKGI